MNLPEPMFSIGQKIYHKTPESDAGIIVDMYYQFGNKTYYYLVSLSYEKSTWCKETELSETKLF